MNGKIKSIITNLSYTFTSNLVSMIISILVVIILPRLIGVSEYGYFQLYIFYTLYLGFFNIGWVEGIYLRYGGEEYNKLNKNLFASQFWSFFLYIIFASIFFAIHSFIYVEDYNKQFIFQMVSICLIMSVPRGFLLYVLQAINRIKDFSKITLCDRGIYCLTIMLMLLLGIREYKMLIIADLIGKTITFLGTVYICKEIVFSKMVPLKDNLNEMIANILVGIKLMFANIASMLIIGVVRFGIERSWDVKTFGKVSLTLGVSNLMMFFINAVGIIIFPLLRRTDGKKLSDLYVTIRDLLMAVLFGALLVYYPIKIVLSAWLPDYADSLMYMAIVFPMFVYEGKMALLINTYLKTLRKEKLMLRVNVISLMLSLIVTLFTTQIFRNLDTAIESIVFFSAFRCVLAEIFLSKIIKVSIYKDIGLELTMTLAFILIGWFINTWVAVVLYILFYAIYLIIKRKDIAFALQCLKLLLKA